MSSQRLVKPLVALIYSLPRRELLSVGDKGSALRYFGLWFLALGVGGSSLTFSWVVVHNIEQNFFPEFAGLVLYISDLFLIAGLAVWTGGWTLSPQLNLRFGPWYAFIPLGVIALLSVLSILWSVDAAQAGYTAVRRVLC